MIVIIAGDLRQAEDYAIRHGLKRGDWMFPLQGRDLKGMRRVTSAVRCGTWRDRPDVWELIETVEHYLRRLDNKSTSGEE